MGVEDLRRSVSGEIDRCRAQLSLKGYASLHALHRAMAKAVQSPLGEIAQGRRWHCLALTGADRDCCSGQALPGSVDDESLPADIDELIGVAGAYRDR